jgi:hypothetical protein
VDHINIDIVEDIKIIEQYFSSTCVLACCTYPLHQAVRHTSCHMICVVGAHAPRQTPGTQQLVVSVHRQLQKQFVVLTCNLSLVLVIGSDTFCVIQKITNYSSS